MNKKGGLSIMPKYDLSKSSNIIDVIEQYIDVNVVGDRAICDCPFCKETGPYMIISKQSNSFKCFTCGESGNADDFVKKYESYVMGNDAQLFNSDISKLEQKIQILAKINNDAGKFYHEQLNKNSKAMGYFSERQLNKATIRHFGLGYAPGGKRDLFNHLTNLGYSQNDIQRAGLITVTKEGWVYDKFQDRVMFPIINKDGYIIGFGGRVMGEATPQNPKYLNSPATEIFDKSVNLFALNYALKSDRKGMILCEGYMDVIASHQSGFTNAVASLGTAFTSSHARIIAQHTDTGYLSFDNDTAGINAEFSVFEYIARNFVNNVRELEGAFNKVSAYADIEKVDLTLDYAKKVLKCEDKKQKITIADAAKAVGDYYGVSVEDFLSSARNQRVSSARQVAVYVAREITQKSFESIAEFFQKKHTTMLYSYDKVKNEIATNKELESSINQIKDIIKGMN